MGGWGRVDSGSGLVPVGLGQQDGYRGAGHRKTSRGSLLSPSLSRTSTGPRGSPPSPGSPSHPPRPRLTWPAGCRRHGKGRGAGLWMRFHCGAFPVVNELRLSPSHLATDKLLQNLWKNCVHIRKPSEWSLATALKKETQRGCHSKAAKFASPETFALRLRRSRVQSRLLGREAV